MTVTFVPSAAKRHAYSQPMTPPPTMASDSHGDVSLTPKEYELLVELASDPGAVLTREHLIDSVWDEHWWGSTKTLDVHMASLRKKLAPELIETVRGVGFRLVELDGGG